jgi:hypothetical protein
MEQPERPLSEQESLDLIAKMINRARDSYHDTGVSAMMWGIVIAVCSIEKFCEVQFGFHLPVNIYWLTIVAVIPQIIISMRENKKRKAKTYDEEYMDTVWVTFGISIFLMIFITNVIFNVLPVSDRDLFSEYVCSLFLLLYGIPTFITGAACGFKPMLWGGILCWACCIIGLFTEIRIDFLLTGFAAIVAWLIPGIIMQGDYRKAKKELADQNV